VKPFPTLVVAATLVAAGAAGAGAPPPQAVEACPVLKVNIAELPASHKLRMYPSMISAGHAFTSADFIGQARPEKGINIAVLWQNKTSQPLRDLVVRLEYQQAKTGAFATLEQQVREARPGGQSTEFRLRGGEFEDTEHIAAWRVTVISAGQVLGQKKSVMWR